MSDEENSRNSDEEFVMVENCADHLLDGLDENGQPPPDEDEVATVPVNSAQSHSNNNDWVNVDPQSSSSSGAMSLEIIEVSPARPMDSPVVVNEVAQGSSASPVSLGAVDMNEGELTLTTGSSVRRIESHTRRNPGGLIILSQEPAVQSIHTELLNQYPALVAAANVSSDDLSVSVPNSQGSNPDRSYPSLNEEAFSLPSSQESYSGMNPDSPAGSQPQSMASLPIQFPSQSSQTSTTVLSSSQDSTATVPSSSQNSWLQTHTLLDLPSFPSPESSANQL